MKVQLRQVTLDSKTFFRTEPALEPRAVSIRFTKTTRQQRHRALGSIDSIVKHNHELPSGPNCPDDLAPQSTHGALKTIFFQNQIP